MQTSGLILDLYDDHDGAVLRAVYPTPADIPTSVKEAQVLSAEERRTLPDDVYALVLLNNGEALRKYACIDAGSTVLAVEYFLKTAHKLPVNAQQTAAENLLTACGWYGIEAPEKLAGIAGTALTALTLPSLVKGTHASIKNNMGAVRAGEAAGAGVVTPQMMKSAEASGTALLPNQPTLGLPGASKTVTQKTARHGGHGGHGHHHGQHRHGAGGAAMELVEPVAGEQRPRLPQAGHLRPRVDVSNHTPPTRVTEKQASRFALPSDRRYPLDTYEQVKTASGWYDEYAHQLSPMKRREFASNFMKRANELDIHSASDDLRRYGSSAVASEAEVKAAFDMRRLEIAHNDEALQLLGAVEKVARTRVWRDADSIVQLAPEQICNLVEEFDKVAGLNYRYDVIPDPVLTVFGTEKTAEEDLADWSDVIGNDYVTSEDLQRLSQIGAFSVKTTFGSDFQEEFLKDPVGMYKSLPRTKKLMLIRMANSTQPGVERTY